MRSKVRSFSVFILIIPLAYLFSSCFENCHTCNCNDIGKVYYNYDVAPVESAEFLEDTVSSTDTLRIAFYGTIGNDSCHTFAYFNASSVEHQTDIFVMRAEKKIWCSTPVCPSATIGLNGITHSISPLTPGVYKVVIRQPDGSTLVKEAFVQ